MQYLKFDDEPAQIREAIVGHLLNSRRAGQGPLALAEILTEICQQLILLRNDLRSIQTDPMIVKAVRRLLDDAEGGVPDEAFSLLPPKSAHLLASEAWDPADGFYQAEWTDSGRPFRWVGPDREFRFVVRIDRSNPLKAVLKAPFAHRSVEVGRLTCRIDGRPAPLQIVKTEHDFIVTAIAPARKGGRCVVLDFDGPSPAPASSDGSDPRLLSMAVSELSLEPIPVAAGEVAANTASAEQSDLR